MPGSFFIKGNINKHPHSEGSLSQLFSELTHSSFSFPWTAEYNGKGWVTAWYVLISKPGLVIYMLILHFFACLSSWIFLFFLLYNAWSK